MEYAHFQVIHLESCYVSETGVLHTYMIFVVFLVNLLILPHPGPSQLGG